MKKILKFIGHQLNPIEYMKAILCIGRVVFTRRGLLWEMSKRDIQDRYAGQCFGSLWAVIYPVFIISLYIFVFAYVFQIKSPSSGKGTDDFTIYLLSGLLSWMSFQEILGRSPNAIINETSMVKQVVFPVEVIPLKAIFSAVLTQSIGTALLVFFVFIKQVHLSWSLILWPVILGLQIISMVGVSLFLSSISPFFKDTKDFVQIGAQTIMYTTPIFYSINMVPSWAKPIILANPVTHMVLCYQDVLYYGAIYNAYSWLYFCIFSIFMLGAGCRSFSVLKNFFGSVL